MNRTQELVETVGRQAVKPIIGRAVWEWAEEHVRLSVRTTISPGRYDSSWMPYARAWQAAWSDPRIREIILCCGSQVGKTESVLNCVRYSVAMDPGPMLFVMPAESLARSFSETRLLPSLRDCAPCAAQLPENPDEAKLLEIHFRGCTLNLVGANSPGQLSSRPVRYLILDEIDKFPEAGSKEAGALELARTRTATYWNRKICMTSTPTVETGQVWLAYLSGSQNKFFVPCPFCGAHQELIFQQVKWPGEAKQSGEWDLDAVEKQTWYECIVCGKAIQQGQRSSMLRAGEWRPTNPKSPVDRVSFHLNGLYSPWRSWGSLAREFLESKDSPSGLQNFTNSILAEPWKVLVGEAVSERRLLDLRSDYDLGTCPVRPHRITVAVDVQRDSIYFTVRAWGQNAESWLIDYGQVPSLDDLNEISSRLYNIKGSAETNRPSRALIDSGYNAQQVYDICASSAGRFFAAKGWEKLRQPVQQTAIKFLPTRGRWERSLPLIHYDDTSFKYELYIRRIQDGEGPGWHLPMNVGADYLRQMTAEKLVEHKNHRGQIRQVWHRTHRHNHYGDCEKMQLVAGYMLSSLFQSPLPEPPTESAASPPPGDKPSSVLGLRPPAPRAKLKRYLPFRKGRQSPPEEGGW